MKRKDIRPSATEISKILTNARFNPAKDKVMAIVSNQASLDFYECDMIVHLTNINDCAETITKDEYLKKMNMVIREAALCIHYAQKKELLNGPSNS